MCLTCRASEAFAARVTSRRSFLRSIGGAAAGFALAPSAFAKDAKQAAASRRTTFRPDEALRRLMKGNARYVEGVSRRHDFKSEREALVGGQNPYAGILSCADFAHRAGICLRQRQGRSVRVPGRGQFRQ